MTRIKTGKNKQTNKQNWGTLVNPTTKQFLHILLQEWWFIVKLGTCDFPVSVYLPFFFFFFTLSVQLNQPCKLRGLSWSFYFHDEWWCPSSVCISKSNAKLEFYLCLQYFPSVLASFRLFKHASPMSLTAVVVWVAQSCPTLCDPMDCSPPGSSVHGILQARILEWVAIPFSRVSSPPGDWTQVSCTAGSFCTVWATGKPMSLIEYLVINFAIFILVVVHVTGHVFLTLFKYQCLAWYLAYCR